MVEEGESRLGGIESLAIVVGMAMEAIVHIINHVVRSEFFTDLVSDIAMAVHTERSQCRFKRLVTQTAIAFKGRVRGISLEQHTRLAFCAQPARAECQPSSPPEQHT
jgi:hypothetical protein